MSRGHLANQRKDRPAGKLDSGFPISHPYNLALASRVMYASKVQHEMVGDSGSYGKRKLCSAIRNVGHYTRDERPIVAQTDVYLKLSWRSPLAAKFAYSRQI